MAEAFTAGVRPGGLTDDTQIRMLLCYLVKVAGPVKRETMQGALLQEQLVNYFEFADALAEVEKQQLVTVDEEGGRVARLMNTVGTTKLNSMYSYRSLGTQGAHDGGPGRGVVLGSGDAFDLDLIEA